jgi:hypothetical protein
VSLRLLFVSFLLLALLGGCQSERIKNDGFTLTTSIEEVQFRLDTVNYNWSVGRNDVFSTPTTQTALVGSDVKKFPTARLVRLGAADNIRRFFEVRMPLIYQRFGTVISAQQFYNHFRAGSRPLFGYGLDSVVALTIQPDSGRPQYTTFIPTAVGTFDILETVYGLEESSGLPIVKTRVRFETEVFSPQDTATFIGTATLRFRLNAN